MESSVLKMINKLFQRYFPLVAVFAGSLFNPGDSDLGWHLKYGEYFFKNFITLQTNIFSTTMPGYHWINSSWGTDLITYWFFSKFGFFGLTIIGALTITIAYLFFAKAAKLNFWQQSILIPIILNLEEPLFQVSFRGHLLSLLLLGILSYLLVEFNQKESKRIFFTIPLFMIWSNIHGEFILGLSVFALFIVTYFIKKLIIECGFPKVFSLIRYIELLKKQSLLFSAFLLSLVSSVINPFSIGIYLETLRHFGNPLQKYIVEWLPLETNSAAWWKLLFWGVIILSSFLIYKSEKNITRNLPVISITLIMYLMSFWMRRYVWAMFLLSLPMVSVILNALKPKSEKISQAISYLVIIAFYLFTVLVKNPNMGIGGMTWEKYCLWYVGCSDKASDFIIKNKLNSNILTFYNWGGWLIWNYPDIKPSIDGRMHLWRDEKGFSAFAVYYAYEQDWEDVNKSDYTVVYINRSKPLYKQMLKHVEDKSWKLRYEDELSAVFTRV